MRSLADIFGKKKPVVKTNNEVPNRVIDEIIKCKKQKISEQECHNMLFGDSHSILLKGVTRKLIRAVYILN